MYAERRLRLTENRRLSRGKAHVARQHEFAAGAAHAPLDLRDRDEAACAQIAKQQADRRFAGQLRRLLPVLVDPGHVDVGNEIVGVGALEHEHLDGVVGLGSLDERDQIADQLGPEKIHRRGRNLREQDGPFLAHFERLVFQVIFGPAFSHFSSIPFVRVAFLFSGLGLTSDFLIFGYHARREVIRTLVAREGASGIPRMQWA